MFITIIRFLRWCVKMNYFKLCGRNPATVRLCRDTFPTTLLGISSKMVESRPPGGSKVEGFLP